MRTRGIPARNPIPALPRARATARRSACPDRWLRTVLLTAALWGVASLHAEVLFEFAQNRSSQRHLNGWRTLAGEWASTPCIAPIGQGLNLLLFETPLGAHWQMEVECVPIPIEFLVWWLDADNWLSLALEREHLVWRGKLNGLPIAEQRTGISPARMYRLVLGRMHNQFKAELNGERLTWFVSQLAETGKVGLRAQNASGRGYYLERPQGIRYLKITRLASASQQEPSPPFTVEMGDLQSLAQQLAHQCARDSRIGSEWRQTPLVVASFEYVDQPTAPVGDKLAEDLSTVLSRAGFTVVERRHLTALLKELKLQMSGLTDPNTAQTLGNLVGARWLLVGTIADAGDRVVLNTRLIEVRTGATLLALRHDARKRFTEGAR